MQCVIWQNVGLLNIVFKLTKKIPKTWHFAKNFAGPGILPVVAPTPVLPANERVINISKDGHLPCFWSFLPDTDSAPEGSQPKAESLWSSSCQLDPLVLDFSIGHCQLFRALCRIFLPNFLSKAAFLLVDSFIDHLYWVVERPICLDIMRPALPYRYLLSVAPEIDPHLA